MEHINRHNRCYRLHIVKTNHFWHCRFWIIYCAQWMCWAIDQNIVNNNLCIIYWRWLRMWDSFKIWWGEATYFYIILTMALNIWIDYMKYIHIEGGCFNTKMEQKRQLVYINSQLKCFCWWKFKQAGKQIQLGKS